MQQAIASNRCAVHFFAAICHMFKLARQQHCTACLLLMKHFQLTCSEVECLTGKCIILLNAAGRKKLVMVLPLQRLLKTQLFSR